MKVEFSFKKVDINIQNSDNQSIQLSSNLVALYSVLLAFYSKFEIFKSRHVNHSFKVECILIFGKVNSHTCALYSLKLHPHSAVIS